MDMREEFELHYAEEFSMVRGYKPSPEEMVSMRDGDGYGSDRGYLNGYWKGWQASREKLVVDLGSMTNNGYEGFYPANQIKRALRDSGIRTK